MVTTDDEDLAWEARSFRDHGYDVKERLNLLELEQKLPYIHNMVGWNYRMTEMQSAIGLAELERMDNWNMPRRRRNAHILMDALKDVAAGQVLARSTRPSGRTAGIVLAFSLDIENMKCDIKEFVKAAGAEGAPVLEGVLAAMPHRARLPGAQRLRPYRLPVQVEGIRRPGERRLQQRRGAQRPLARGPHLHLLRLPDLHGATWSRSAMPFSR